MGNGWTTVTPEELAAKSPELIRESNTKRWLRWNALSEQERENLSHASLADVLPDPLPAGVKIDERGWPYTMVSGDGDEELRAQNIDGDRVWEMHIDSQLPYPLPPSIKEDAPGDARYVSNGQVAKYTKVWKRLRDDLRKLAESSPVSFTEYPETPPPNVTYRGSGEKMVAWLMVNGQRSRMLSPKEVWERVPPEPTASTQTSSAEANDQVMAQAIELIGRINAADSELARKETVPWKGEPVNAIRGETRQILWDKNGLDMEELKRLQTLLSFDQLRRLSELINSYEPQRTCDVTGKKFDAYITTGQLEALQAGHFPITKLKWAKTSSEGYQQLDRKRAEQEVARRAAAEADAAAAAKADQEAEYAAKVPAEETTSPAVAETAVASPLVAEPAAESAVSTQPRSTKSRKTRGGRGSGAQAKAQQHQADKHEVSGRPIRADRPEDHDEQARRDRVSSDGRPVRVTPLSAASEPVAEAPSVTPTPATSVVGSSDLDEFTDGELAASRAMGEAADAMRERTRELRARLAS